MLGRAARDHDAADDQSGDHFVLLGGDARIAEKIGDQPVAESQHVARSETDIPAIPASFMAVPSSPAVCLVVCKACAYSALGSMSYGASEQGTPVRRVS